MFIFAIIKPKYFKEDKFAAQIRTQTAKKFLSDRLKLIIQGYGINQQSENGEEGIEKDIIKLKKAELSLLKSYLVCIENI